MKTVTLNLANYTGETAIIKYSGSIEKGLKFKMNGYTFTTSNHYVNKDGEEFYVACDLNGNEWEYALTEDLYTFTAANDEALEIGLIKAAIRYVANHV